MVRSLGKLKARTPTLTSANAESEVLENSSCIRVPGKASKGL